MIENKPSIRDIIKTFNHTFVKLVTDIKELFQVEAQLAGKSALYIIGLLLLSTCTILTIWGGLSSLVVVFLLYLSFSMAISLSILVIINILLLSAFIFFMVRLASNLSFSATRRQLVDLKIFNKENSNEELKA